MKSQPTSRIPQPNRITIPGGTFEPEGHIYRDTEDRRVLSVTQIFQSLGMVDYGGVNPEILQRKSAIGIAVHRSIELLLQNQLDWDTVDDTAMAYVVGTEIWLRDNGFVLEAAEQQGIHLVNGMKYGYQMDLRGTIPFNGVRRPIIIDLKTTIQRSPTWEVQTAAYALAAPDLPKGERYLRAILHLQKDGRVKPYYFEDPQDEHAFLYMLYVAIWKQNHGLLAA